MANSERLNTASSLDKRGGGFEGVSTPWGTLNKNIQGWVNGYLHVIAAMQQTGKTWALCFIANHACYVEKKKVLFVSLEMAEHRIQRRLDALKYKLPFNQLRDGELDSETEKEWKEKLSEEEKKDAEFDIFIVDKKLVTTVNDVAALVTQLSPDLVLIDGGYRFDAPGKVDGWERTVTIVNSLQSFAEKTCLPWVVTTQLGDKTETGKASKTNTTMRAWNVRYGKEWVINPDVLIGLHQDDDLRLISQTEVHTLKVRDAGKLIPQFNIMWDLEEMDFSEIELEDDGTAFSGKEGSEVSIDY